VGIENQRGNKEEIEAREMREGKRREEVNGLFAGLCRLFACYCLPTPTCLARTWDLKCGKSFSQSIF